MRKPACYSAAMTGSVPDQNALAHLGELVRARLADNPAVYRVPAEPVELFAIGDFLSASRVLGFATVVAAVDVVIITAVATLFAFLYNLAATVMGGLEITLAED